MAKKKAASESASDSASESPAALQAKTHQAFERVVVKRSQLVFHERNPRIIDPHAFKKLKAFIKKNGLLGGIAINRRRAAAGFPESQEGRLVIIGGHQRTKAMDELSGFNPSDVAGSIAAGADYNIPADLCNLDASREAEVLVALNNPGMQGAWDHDLLSQVLATPGVNPLDTGFDRIELMHILDSGAVAEIFGDGGDSQPSPDAAVLGAFEDVVSDVRDARADAVSGGSLQTPQASSQGGQQGERLDPNSVEAMKDRRVDYRSNPNFQAENQNPFIVLMANATEHVRTILYELGFPEGEQYVSLPKFLDAVGRQDLRQLIEPDGEGGPAESGGETDGLV